MDPAALLGLLLLVAALDLGVALDGLLALRDKPRPVALMLLLGFVAVLRGASSIMARRSRACRSRCSCCAVNWRSFSASRSRCLWSRSDSNFFWISSPPAVEMRLAPDQLGGAAGQAGALHVELLQGLPFAVVYGLDVVPVPVDRPRRRGISARTIALWCCVRSREVWRRCSAIWSACCCLNCAAT